MTLFPQFSCDITIFFHDCTKFKSNFLNLYTIDYHGELHTILGKTLLSQSKHCKQMSTLDQYTIGLLKLLLCNVNAELESVFVLILFCKLWICWNFMIIEKRFSASVNNKISWDRLTKIVKLKVYKWSIRKRTDSRINSVKAIYSSFATWQNLLL